MSDSGDVNQSTTDGSDAAEQAGAENDTSGATSAAGDGFKPITSQRELEQALKTRLDRERAKFKDYDDLKAKAAKFDQVTEAAKSDLQLALERAEAAERRSSELETERQIAGWRTEVSRSTNGRIPADVLRGNTLEEIEAHAASLVALLPEPKKGGQVPAEGRTVTTGSGDPANQFAELLRNARRS